MNPNIANIYTIKDTLANSYVGLFQFDNDALCLRSLQAEYEHGNPLLVNFFKDKQVWMIATIDKNTMAVNGDARFVAALTSFCEVKNEN